MSLTAVEKIKDIQERAELEIKELRKQAVSEIVRKLSETKEEIRVLEGQYAALTGKPAPSEPAAEQPEGKRKHLTADERVILIETLRGLLAAAPTGISMGELVRQSGKSIAAVRKVLAEIPTETTGAKTSTRYFLK